MPELPEVETTRLGISPWIVGKKIKKVKIDAVVHLASTTNAAADFEICI